MDYEDAVEKMALMGFWSQLRILQIADGAGDVPPGEVQRFWGQTSEVTKAMWRANAVALLTAIGEPS